MKKTALLLVFVILIFSVISCQKESKVLTTEETVKQLMENSWKIMGIYRTGTESMISSWDKSCEENGVTYYRASEETEYYSDWENLIRETYSPEIAEYILKTDDMIDYGGYLYVKGGNKKITEFPLTMFEYSIESVTENEIRVKITYTEFIDHSQESYYAEDEYIDKEGITVIKKIDGKWLITEEPYSVMGID